MLFSIASKISSHDRFVDHACTLCFLMDEQGGKHRAPSHTFLDHVERLAEADAWLKQHAAPGILAILREATNM
jgi:hypothetical protein